MFDTNVLFTQVASDLVRQDVKRIVKENSNHPDLKVGWYLPEVVVEERRYQMLGKAKDLLPAMQKLEKLLGHKFGVGEDNLELYVDNAINSSIKECGFQIANIDTNQIDWENLISRSVKRRPPFDANEKEKGFRDSIIAHSFLQLHKVSPATPSICRLALVSGDQPLREYVSESTADSKNVRILSSLEDLESLLNTIVSTVPEDFATELALKAGRLFFEKENQKTFYYKESIGEKIREQYAKELNDTIIPSSIKSLTTWWISSPIFIKKDRQRIHWVSTVEPEFEIFHYESDKTVQTPFLALAEILKSGFPVIEPSAGDTITIASTPPPPALGPIGQGLLATAGSQKKVVDLKGKEKFEVHWNANLSQAQNLISPKLEKIQYMGNNLAEGSS